MEMSTRLDLVNRKLFCPSLGVNCDKASIIKVMVHKIKPRFCAEII